ncbi:sensor histidine kinase [Defluviitalea saccharophila]|uniref:Oxygen sensor histidine kinase NreB n=1 Tax=Defluviitalea saccharophila TaxID=879970 RepID=A0ABZ2Y291_9FIRM
MSHVNMDQLDKILKRTIDSIEQSKNEIYDIAEHAQQEYQQLQQELNELKTQISNTIDLVESFEKALKKSRLELMQVNKNFEKYSQEEMKEIYAKADQLRISLAVEKEREQMLIQKRNELEVRLKRSAKTVEKAENLINHVAIAMNFLTGDLKDISNQIEDLQEKKSLGIKILRAQENERQRVAREIHDGPAQSMSNVVLKSELCIKLLDRDLDKARQELINLKEMVRISIQDVRRIIYDLRPMSLDDLGIIPTLERYISKINEEHDIMIKFITKGTPCFLPSIISLTLFRLAQEALNNILKHAHATEATVKLSFLEEYIELFISDNGRGFDVEEVHKKIRDDGSGFGLSSMKERTELLDGEFSIRSELNQGTRYYIRIPLKENEV